MTEANTAAAGAPTLSINLDTKTYSNMCKRLAAQLQTQHGVTLTHTQARTALSEALGFDSPNALDALLRAKAASDKASPNSGAGSSKPESDDSDDSDDAARVDGQRHLRDLLKDPITKDPHKTAIDLVGLSLSLMAQQFPAKLSSADKAAIRRSYPGATDALMKERSMTTEGVATAVALAMQSARIAVDYYPGSDCTAQIANDDKVGPAIGPLFGDQLMKSFDGAVKKGMSPFGAATTLILTGSAMGIQNGASWASLVRTLLEAVQMVATDGASLFSSKDIEEQAIQAVMAQMGISRAEAKKYAKMAKQMRDRG